MPFKRDSAYEDQTKYVLWVIWTIIASFVTLYVMMLLMLPLKLLLDTELSILTWREIARFWKTHWADNNRLILLYIAKIKAFSKTVNPSATSYLIFVPFISFFVVFS